MQASLTSSFICAIPFSPKKTGCQFWKRKQETLYPSSISSAFRISPLPGCCRLSRLDVGRGRRQDTRHSESGDKAGKKAQESVSEKALREGGGCAGSVVTSWVWLPLTLRGDERLPAVSSLLSSGLACLPQARTALFLLSLALGMPTSTPTTALTVCSTMRYVGTSSMNLCSWGHRLDLIHLVAPLAPNSG